MTETFPAFVAAAPTLRVHDPLAAFLGPAARFTRRDLLDYDAPSVA